MRHFFEKDGESQENYYYKQLFVKIAAQNCMTTSPDSSDSVLCILDTEPHL